MLRDLKTEVFYPHPPQRVWQVLTNRRALAAWLMDNDFEPRVGHKFRFQTQSLPGLEGTIDCEVIELDEPRRLSYTWQDSLMAYPSIVTWTLTPVDGGTRLHLEHQGVRQEAITLGEFRRSTHTWQRQFMDEPTAVTQTLAPRDRSTLFQSTSIGYAALDSVILSSYLNGGWNYTLNERLPQLIYSFATDNK
jgi:uncharacterized protein YndB with AHSA1/START domain